MAIIAHWISGVVKDLSLFFIMWLLANERLCICFERSALLYSFPELEQIRLNMESTDNNCNSTVSANRKTIAGKFLKQVSSKNIYGFSGTHLG